MISVRLVPEAEWRIWPIVTSCDCESSTGKRISLPFFSLWILKDKVA